MTIRTHLNSQPHHHNINTAANTLAPIGKHWDMLTQLLRE